MKTVTILALVATFTLGTVSNAFAGPPIPFPGPIQPNPFPGPIVPNPLPGPIVPNPAPPNQPAPNQPAPQVHHHRHRSGAVWGALAGGTVLGIVMSGIANQPKQTTPTQVVVVQQPADDATSQQQYLELELERERAKTLALEMEIERLKANSD